VFACANGAGYMAPKIVLSVGIARATTATPASDQIRARLPRSAASGRLDIWPTAIIPPLIAAVSPHAISAPYLA
jgi:hypothetical protein